MAYIWQCEINSNVKSFMKMTRYVGGKFIFVDVCAVKSAVKTVMKSAVTSVAKFDLNLAKNPSQNPSKILPKNPSKNLPKKSFHPTYVQLPN